MRVVIEFNRSSEVEETELDEEAISDETTGSAEFSNNYQWLLPLLTCSLAIAIVFRPISELVKSIPPVVWYSQYLFGTTILSIGDL